VVWRVLDDMGTELARAPLVVLAAGAGLPVLVDQLPSPQPGLGPLELTRGQLTWFAADTRLKRPVSGHGYAVSLPDGRLLCGASLRAADADPQVQDEDQRWNLDRLRVLTGLAPPSGAALKGRVSWRVQTPDRLPLIGPAPQADLAVNARRDQTRFIRRHPGLFIIGALGSRGLIWAPLAARVLCGWVEATPMPLEAELLDAVDPARWLVRQARRLPAP
jgi:tRNA 5-methylaminomethyl-2-thiouridine biosynthesis bifunctional protein